MAFTRYHFKRLKCYEKARCSCLFLSWFFGHERFIRGSLFYQLLEQICGKYQHRPGLSCLWDGPDEFLFYAFFREQAVTCFLRP
jgi:hypothetical protein